jgi:prepilin-type N-terminal cleavage/methylation domain-containing protein
MIHKRRGFTLTELIVVILLMLILFAVAGLFLRNTQRAYDHVQSLNSLKQVALACQSANDIYRRLPPAYGPFGPSPAGSQSFHYHLLPFIEQDNLWKTYHPAARVSPFLHMNDSVNTDGAGVQNFAANLRVFSDTGLATAYNADIAFGEPHDSATWDSGAGRARIPDSFEPRGTSYTIMLGTRYANNTRLPVIPGAPNCSAHAGRPYHENGAFFGAVAAVNRANPDSSVKPTYQLSPSNTNVDCSFSAFAHSFRNGGLSVALGDCSLRTISPDLPPELWNRAMQPNTNLLLGDEWTELSRLCRQPTPAGIRE